MDKPRITMEVYCYRDDLGRRRFKVKGGIPDTPGALAALEQGLHAWRVLTTKPTKLSDV